MRVTVGEGGAASEARRAASRPALGRAAGRGAAGAPDDFGEALERAGEAALDALLAAGEAADATGAGPGAPPSPREPVPGAGSPLLARAVERVAVLVQSGISPSVTIELGRSLDVRVEQVPGGVEVALRAACGLSPLAEAELPLLVASLRARGVRVARAGVLGRRSGGRASLTGGRPSATNAADDGTVAKW